MSWEEKRAGAACSSAAPAFSDRNRRLMIERIKSLNPSFGVRADARGIDPDHSVLFSAKGADASLVHSDGRGLNRVADVNPTCARPGSRDKSVTALATAGGIAVVRQD